MENCLKRPIEEIRIAQQLLIRFQEAHLAGDFKKAEEYIQLSDLPQIREWTESIWGKGGVYTQLKEKYGEPETIPISLRDSLRMPTKAMENELLARDGHYCRFCGIPVIRKEVREYIRKCYPSALKWGKKNAEQHAAFQAMWVQYDHIIPHARGGRTIIDNLVITCGPCNYGRMNFLLEEIGLQLTAIRHRRIEVWDGLEKIGIIVQPLK